MLHDLLILRFFRNVFRRIVIEFEKDPRYFHKFETVGENINSNNTTF